MQSEGAAFAGGISIGAKAAALGHTGETQRVGKRFKVICSCGWSTDSRWTRKRQFQAITAHCLDVVRQSGEFADTPKQDSNSVGGRA